SLWGSSAEGISALIRLRYTGQPALLPEAFDVNEKGIVLQFPVALDEKVATNPANYQLKRWNYKRTEEYGSGHYKLNGKPGEELLPIFSAHLSGDKKSVFLAVPNMEEVMQMQLSYSLESVVGDTMNSNFWFTVHNLVDPGSINERFKSVDLETLAMLDSQVREAETATIPASVKRGEKLFQQTGCMSCHVVKGKQKGR